MSTSPSPRATWWLILASGLGLAAIGAGWVHMQASLARAEDAAEALVAHDQPARAEQALAAWGAPWLETFLRNRQLDPGSAQALAPCQMAMLGSLDALSQGKNQVLHARLRQTEEQATSCAAPALGAEHAAEFARELRVRWDAWVAHEGGNLNDLTP